MDRHRFLVPLLIVVTLLTFWRATSCDFVNYDDGEYVSQNPRVLTGLSPANVAWAFTTFHTANYHPLTWLSFMLDAQVWGNQPRGYHLSNVLLHALAVVLLYAALCALTGSRWRSGLVALLFGIHPLRVESVAWISERKDVLSGCLAFAAILAYAQYVRRPSWWRYLLVAACFTLGLLAKPSLVPLPFLLLLLDVWPLNRVRGLSLPVPSTRAPICPPRPAAALLLEKLPLVILTAASCVVTYLAQHNRGAVRGLDRLPILYRLANVPTAYVRYMGKMLWFRGLIVDYFFRIVPLWQVAASAVLLIAITAIVLRRFRRSPWLAIGWFWFLGMLVPMIGLVQAGNQALADRYTYLPTIGLLVMLVWSLPERAFQSGPARLVLAGAALAATAILATFTWLQIGYWQDSVTLFTHVVKIEPDNYVGLVNLGVAYGFQRNQPWDGVFYLQEAARLRPGAPLAHRDLGMLYLQLNRPQDALYHLRLATEAQSGHPPQYAAMGLAHAQLNELDAALDDFRHALAEDPDNIDAYYQAARVLDRMGRPAEAVAPLQEMVRRQPNAVRGNGYLGYILVQLGRRDEAIPYLQKAIQLDPHNQRSRDVLAQVVAAGKGPGRAGATQP